MSALRAWFLRVGGLFHKEQRDLELDDEIQSHLQMQIEDNLREGMTPEQARREARLKFGGIESVKEKYREQRGIPWLETFLQDIRFGLRMLRKNPGFTSVAILTLTLGIGVNTAIFSVINTVLLNPLPYAHADRIVQLENSSSMGSGPVISIPKFMAFREQSQLLQNVSAYSGALINLTGTDRPEQLKGMRVSEDFFSLFGVSLSLGRTFNSEEDSPNGPHAAVISQALWRTRYGGGEGIVGRTIEIRGEPYVVIGVLRSSFQWNYPVDIFLPLQPDVGTSNGGNYLYAAGRMKTGVSIEQLRAALRITAAEFRKKYPNDMRADSSFTAERLKDVTVANARTALYVLFGTVVFVLLIACANITSLLLARAAAREREIAIRAALGAAPGRIMRQLLVESTLLAVLGGALGLAGGYFGLHALLALNPGNIPRIGEHGSAVTLDWRVLGFTALISIFTGVIFGLVPAAQASRIELNSVLKESGASSGTGLRQHKARTLLVVSEVALAYMLLIGSALLIRTYVALRTVRSGFDPHNVLTMTMSLDGQRFQHTAPVAQLVSSGIERLKNLPGVEDAAAGCALPLTLSYTLPFVIEGRPLTDGPFSGSAGWRNVSTGYFEVFRIPTMRGRAFTERDDATSPAVTVVNESMAKKFWPNDDPIGKRLIIGKGGGPIFEDTPREIVGIVGDVRDDGLNADPIPIMYVPVAQVRDSLNALTMQITPLAWAVRTKAPPLLLSRAAQHELETASGGLPIGNIRSMEEVVADSTSREDFNTVLVTTFAAVAMLLAIMGVYALMSYSVQQKTREIGIRMALGARPQQVRNMLARQGMGLAIVGILVGIVASLGLTGLMSGMIYGVKPRDPWVFAIASLLFAIVAFVAICVPSWKATRIDPMVALRCE